MFFLVDSQAGVRPYDEQIAKYLQTCKEKVLLVVN
eukprot:COSAG01_NODE_75800_length_192_cov_1027.795699_2_plen_34_part_01